MHTFRVSEVLLDQARLLPRTKIAVILTIGLLTITGGTKAFADTCTPDGDVTESANQGMSLKGNVTSGSHLFADRGCVICHSINNVGGHIGPSLDAGNIDLPQDPFSFFARMWRGADQMLHLQRADLGYEIDFSGQDLADIYSFIQNGAAQENFTEDDLPDHIRDIIENEMPLPTEGSQP